MAAKGRFQSCNPTSVLQIEKSQFWKLKFKDTLQAGTSCWFWERIFTALKNFSWANSWLFCECLDWAYLRGIKRPGVFWGQYNYQTTMVIFLFSQWKQSCECVFWVCVTTTIKPKMFEKMNEWTIFSVLFEKCSTDSLWTRKTFNTLHLTFFSKPGQKPGAQVTKFLCMVSA